MAVLINLDDILRRRGITSKELCELVGITEANMSILRSGKAKAVRFCTLNKICYFLQCKPGDILDFNGVLDDERNELLESDNKVDDENKDGEKCRYA